MGETIIFEQVPQEECRQLLSGRHVGRIAVVEDGQPIVLPVNYLMDGDSIVIRTNYGTKFAAGPQRLVAFEIDNFAEESRAGWSVLVKGICYDITTTRDHRSETLRNLHVDSWLPVTPTQWLEIVPSEITGRRIREAP